MRGKRNRARRGRDRLATHRPGPRSRAWWQGPWLIVGAAGGIALVLVVFVLLGQATLGSPPA